MTESMPEVEYICNLTRMRWTWELRSVNNRLLARSAFDYADEHGARRGFNKMLKALRPMVVLMEGPS